MEGFVLLPKEKQTFSVLALVAQMDLTSYIPDNSGIPSTTNCCTAKRQPLIVVIEDDQDNLLLLYHLIKSIECDVLLAREGHTGLGLVKETQPDLILLDIVMPRLSGFDVLQQLRQLSQARSIPIVAVTGLASSEEKEQLLAAGCCDYLCKPYLIDELQSMICQHLSLPRIPQSVKHRSI